MNNYQVRFLKQAVLGQHVKLDNSDDVVRRCIELADRDMLSGGRFVCEDFNKPSKKERIDYILETLKASSYDYSKVNKREVCNTVFWNCDEVKSKTIKGKGRDYKPLGFAQKIVNMTYKYLYVFRDHIDVEIDFCKCECPVDSVILEKLGRNEKWTNLTFDEYESIQCSIDNALKDEQYSVLKAEIGALAFDDNWVNTEE